MKEERLNFKPTDEETLEECNYKYDYQDTEFTDANFFSNSLISLSLNLSTYI